MGDSDYTIKFGCSTNSSSAVGGGPVEIFTRHATGCDLQVRPFSSLAAGVTGFAEGAVGVQDTRGFFEPGAPASIRNATADGVGTATVYVSPLNRYSDQKNLGNGKISYSIFSIPTALGYLKAVDDSWVIKIGAQSQRGRINTDYVNSRQFSLAGENAFLPIDPLQGVTGSATFHSLHDETERDEEGKTILQLGPLRQMYGGVLLVYNPFPQSTDLSLAPPPADFTLNLDLGYSQTWGGIIVSRDVQDTDSSDEIKHRSSLRFDVNGTYKKNRIQLDGKINPANEQGSVAAGVSFTTADLTLQATGSGFFDRDSEKKRISNLRTAWGFGILGGMATFKTGIEQQNDTQLGLGLFYNGNKQGNMTRHHLELSLRSFTNTSFGTFNPWVGLFLEIDSTAKKRDAIGVRGVVGLEITTNGFTLQK